MTTPQNPIALGANILRQITETANQTVQTIGNQVAATNSQILRSIASGQPPPLPIPGVQGGLPLPMLPGMMASNGNGNPGHNSNGNPNGNLGIAGLPSPAQLIPRPLLVQLNQLENAILPPGLPRPSAMLLALADGRPPTESVEEIAPVVAGVVRPGERQGVEGLNGLDRRGARVGIQLV